MFIFIDQLMNYSIYVIRVLIGWMLILDPSLNESLDIYIYLLIGVVLTVYILIIINSLRERHCTVLG